MSLSIKRPWRVQEFTAHDESVNCVAFGHKSGQILVTGGDDKKVNFWAVGQKKCLLSLSGHSSPVEAVCFGWLEDVVAAGSLSGSLKIWDLEASKILVTQMGHRSSIKSLTFHPCGNFIATGSSDTNVKIWDIRKKGCVSTYKSHNGSVNCVKFSPDGSWLASAGEDNLVKLWDMTGGQLQAEFRGHSATVNSLDFHPQELILASGSDDKTVKFWNLETMRLTSTVNGLYSPIRTVLFDVDGQRLFAGTHNVLKVFSCPSAACLDSVSVSWGSVVDMARTHTYLVGASYLQTNVSAFVVDISKVPAGTSDQAQSKLVHNAKNRKVRKMSLSSRATSAAEAAPEDCATAVKQCETSPGQVSSVSWSRSVLSPLLRVAASSQPCGTDSGQDLEDGSVPDQASSLNPDTVSCATRKRSSLGLAVNKSTRSLSHIDRFSDEQMSSLRGGGAKTKLDRELSMPVDAAAAAAAAADTDSVAVTSSRNAAVSRLRQLSRTFSLLSSSSSLSSSSPSLDVRHISLQQRQSVVGVDAMTLKKLTDGHSSFCSLMSDRLHCLTAVQEILQDGNFKAAIDAVSAVDDETLMCDLLGVLVRRPKKWRLNLELCTVVLPVAASLIDSKADNAVSCAVSVIEMVVKNFATLIKTTVSGPPPSNVDIAAEERNNKCTTCQCLLVDIQSALKSHRSVSSEQRHKRTKLLQLLTDSGCV